MKKLLFLIFSTLLLTGACNKSSEFEGYFNEDASGIAPFIDPTRPIQSMSFGFMAKIGFFPIEVTEIELAYDRTVLNQGLETVTEIDLDATVFYSPNYEMDYALWEASYIESTNSFHYFLKDKQKPGLGAMDPNGNGPSKLNLKMLPYNYTGEDIIYTLTVELTELPNVPVSYRTKTLTIVQHPHPTKIMSDVSMSFACYHRDLMEEGGAYSGMYGANPIFDASGKLVGVDNSLFQTDWEKQSEAFFSGAITFTDGTKESIEWSVEIQFGYLTTSQWFSPMLPLEGVGLKYFDLSMLPNNTGNPRWASIVARNKTLMYEGYYITLKQLAQ